MIPSLRRDIYYKGDTLKRLIAGAASIGAVVALTGCSGAGQTHRSSPAGKTDKSPALVVQMPSGFWNFSIKCVYMQGSWFAVATPSSSSKGGPAITPDPTCKHFGG